MAKASSSGSASEPLSRSFARAIAGGTHGPARSELRAARPPNGAASRWRRGSPTLRGHGRALRRSSRGRRRAGLHGRMAARNCQLDKCALISNACSSCGAVFPHPDGKSGRATNLTQPSPAPACGIRVKQARIRQPRHDLPLGNIRLPATTRMQAQDLKPWSKNAPRDPIQTQLDNEPSSTLPVLGRLVEG